MAATARNDDSRSSGQAALEERWQVDVRLKAGDSGDGVAVFTHKLVLVSRSEVLKIILEPDEFKAHSQPVEAARTSLQKGLRGLGLGPIPNSKKETITESAQRTEPRATHPEIPSHHRALYLHPEHSQPQTHKSHGRKISHRELGFSQSNPGCIVMRRSSMGATTSCDELWRFSHSTTGELGFSQSNPRIHAHHRRIDFLPI
ncbi:hypothetical protein Bca101_081205 [Brassica carinata]